jgi:hypothetical protein
MSILPDPLPGFSSLPAIQTLRFLSASILPDASLFSYLAASS